MARGKLNVVSGLNAIRSIAMANGNTPRRNPQNIKRDKHGKFAPTPPKHKAAPQARVGNRKPPPAAQNPNATQKSISSFNDDVMNATIVKEQKRFTAKKKLNDRRLMLGRTKQRKTQTENLKKILLDAKNGNDAQRAVVGKILSQLFGREVNIDWNS